MTGRISMKNTEIGMQEVRRGFQVMMWLAVAGILALSATKGPDTFGYVATDAVPYSFENISATGAAVLAGADDDKALVDLGFPFQFYGQTYTNACLGTNGLLSFNGCNIDFANLDLTARAPSGDFPTVAPYWSDLTFAAQGAGAIYYQTRGQEPNRRFIAQWQSAYAVNGKDGITFQLILFEAGGQILFQYLDVNAGENSPASLGAGATVGIRDTGGQSNGRCLQWSYKVPVISSGMAIAMSPKLPTTLVYQGPASALYADCVNVSAKLTETLTGKGISGKTISFTIGAATASAITEASGVAATTLTLSPSDLPGVTYQVDLSFGPDNVYASNRITPAFEIKQAHAGPILGQPVYTGNVFFWTPGPTSSTATLALSATIRDVDEVCASDIRGAKVSFAIRNGTSLSPIGGASNLPVGLVDPNDKKIGTASATVQYNIGKANAEQLDIAVIVGGGYILNAPAYDTIVMVAKPLAGGWIIGGGKTVNGSDSSGYIAGASGEYTDFGFDIKYNKGGANPQGSADITVRSLRNPDGTVGSVPRTYKIKSTSIAVLAVKAAAGTASFSSKANIVDITDPSNPIAVDSGTPLQLDIKDGNPTGDSKLPPGDGDTIAITIQRKAGGVWFSSKWLVDKTVPMPIVMGEISVK